MSSNDKRDLTTKGTTSKPVGAENTVTGDIVTLPPDADDVIFSTICDSSVTGTVDAELEMSYDKENWCPAVTEEYTEGDSVVGWGNERYVLTKVTDQDKNKHGRGVLNFDTSGTEVESGGTRDVLFNFIQRDKPFNLSWWHKSEDQPSATYKPIIFRHGNKDPFTNGKHINLLPDAGNNEKKNKHLHAPANIGAPARDIFHEKMGADKSFTINKWFKSDHNPTNWTTASTASYTPTKYLSFNNSDVLQEGHSNVYYAQSKCEPIDSVSNFLNFTPFFNNTNGFTFSCWFKTFAPYLKHMWGETYNNFKITADGDFEHYWAHGSNSISVKWDVSKYLVNEWFHLMLVYEGTASYTANGAGTCYKLYINNELVPQNGTPTIGGTPNVSTDTGTQGEWGLMGRNTTRQQWQGGMSDFTVWNKALSTSERAALYNNHGVVNVTSLNFFSEEDCGAWIKLGSGADDALNAGENAHSATNRMQDYSGNDNHFYPYVPSSQNYMDESELKTTDLPPTAPTVYTDDYLPVIFNNGAKITTSSTTGVSGCVYLPFQYADTSTFKMGTVADFNDDSDNFYFARTSSKFTISFWAKFRHLNSSTTISGWKYIFDSGHDTVLKGFSMLCQGDEFHAGFYNAQWTRGHVGADMTGWDDGNWHHIAVTYDGPGLAAVGEGSLTSYLKIYKNGDLQTTTATTYGTWLDSAGNDIDMECQDEAVFGHAHSDYSNQKNLEAFYTHIAIWKTDLTATQIDTIYNNGKPNDISGIESSDLKRYYKFDSQDGTDSAGNHTGTIGTYAYGGKIHRTENIYVADTSPEDTFGNGLTASFTKKVVTTPWGNTKVWSNNNGTNWFGTGSRGLKTRGVAGDNSEAPLIRGDRDWTFSFWMKTTANNQSQWIGTTDINGTGTGWEDQFCIRHDASWMYFQFNDSAGTDTVKKIRMAGVTNMDGTPDDGEWHFYVFTFNADGNSTADADFEFMPTSSPDSTRSLTLYIDGQVCGTAGGGNTIVGTVSDCAITDGNKEWNWFSRVSDQYYAAAGEFNQLAVFNEYMTASEVAALYDGTAGTKGGKPTNVSTKSSCKVCIEFETESFTTTDNTDVEFVNSAYSGTWANDSYRTNKTVATSTLSEIVTITSSDNTYSATTVVNTFDEAAAQGTSLLLSLDGFESDADAWAAYPVGSLLDGNWHNMQITYTPPGSFSEGDNITYGDSTEGNNNLKVYVDGEWVASNASKGGSSTFAGYNKHFKYTTGTFVPGTFGASGWKETSSSTDYNYAFQGAFDQLSLHSEATDLTKAQEFYGKGTIYEGQPHNYQMSDSLTYANVEGWWTFDEGGDSTTVVNDKTSNNIDLTLKYFDSNGNNLTSNSGQSTYIAPTGRAIGEGFTVSITKNLKDDGTWVTTQDQTTRLVLSFNGIESLADHFVAYDVNQTSLDKPTNLLDGLWHNVVISFQGTTDNSGTTYLDDNEIRFGPVSQGSTDQAFHIAVSFDGHKLTGISPLGAVDDGSGGTLSGIAGWNVSKKLASGKMEAGFIIEQKDLRHVNTAATYVPTTYLASGIVEAEGADSIYAFQGGFDESSFHSDNWWIDEAGTTVSPTQYNAEKAKTIYGNTGGLAPAQLTRRSPYDLLDPSSIGATSGSNQYVNPNPYDASSNPSGGVEVYYRWGDITGDCSSSVNDVRSSAADSDARDLSVSLGSMNHSTALDTDASGATDFEKDLTYDNSGTYTMYVEKSTSTTEGGLNTKNVKISGCAASKCQQQSILAPKLPHMRVKWTGSGSCDLGEDKCRAQLWFRRRKK